VPAEAGDFRMEYWRNGVLEKWSIGEMEYWRNGVLEKWSGGVMKYWDNEFCSLINTIF